MEFCYPRVEFQMTLIMIHCKWTMNHRRVTDCEELKKIHTFSKWFWRWIILDDIPSTLKYMLKFHTYAYIHSDTTHKYYLPWTKFKWLQKLSAYVICLFIQVHFSYKIFSCHNFTTQHGCIYGLNQRYLRHFDDYSIFSHFLWSTKFFIWMY